MSSCHNIVCQKPIAVLDQDAMSHMLLFLTDKELINLTQASKTFKDDTENELVKRKDQWIGSMLPHPSCL